MNRVLAFVLGFFAASALFALWFAFRGTGDGIVLTAPGSASEKLTRWRLTADPASGRISLGHDGVSTSPVWTLEPGWFVFVENDTRAWWFNGNDALAEFEFNSPKQIVIHGADNASAAPPEKLIRQIGRQHFQKIAEASAESKRRLGIGP